MTEINGQLSRSSKSKERCYACGSSRLLESDGFIVCSECGTCQEQPVMVQGHYVIYDEIHSLNKSESQQYVSHGRKMHVANCLGSSVGRITRIDMLKTSKTLRIRRLQEQTIMNTHYRLLKGLLLLNRAATHLQLPDQTRDHAAFIIRKVIANSDRRHFTDRIVIVAIILAVRQHQLPIRENDVLRFIPYRNKSKTELNQIKWHVANCLNIRWPSSRPEWFIPQIISHIRKNERVIGRLKQNEIDYDYFMRLEHIARAILNQIDSNQYGGRFPNALAASLVYAIDKELLHVTSQNAVSEAFGLKEYTVRGRYHEVWKGRIAGLIEEIGGEQINE